MTYLFFWFVMQLFNGSMSLGLSGNIGGVAWWAHAGGFLSGVLLFWLFLKPKAVRRHYDPNEFHFSQSWKQHW